MDYRELELKDNLLDYNPTDLRWKYNVNEEINHVFLRDDESESSDNLNGQWDRSLDILIKWHKQLEEALSLKYEEGRNQKYRGLLFTSSLTKKDLSYLSKHLADPKFKSFYPIYIFNSLSKFTPDKAHGLKIKPTKVKDHFCDCNTPSFLRLNGSGEDSKHSKSMSKLYTETLRTKIKYGFIHAATFFKIMSLPICAESDKQKCLAWYCASYNEGELNLQKNLDMFLYQPIDMLDIVYPNNVEELLEELKVIFDELNNINIKVDEVYPAYSELLDKYLDGEQFVDRDKLPVGLARRFDYYTGKYLFDLMKANHKEADLLKLVDIHISADSVKFFKESYTLHDIKDIEFKSISKYSIDLDDKHADAPISVFMLSRLTQRYDQNMIELAGEIRSIRGTFRHSENEQVTCIIKNLKCTSSSRIIIRNVQASGSKLRKNFIRYPWAIYILVYLTIYEGYKFECYIADDHSGAKYMG